MPAEIEVDFSISLSDGWGLGIAHRPWDVAVSAMQHKERLDRSLPSDKVCGLPAVEFLAIPTRIHIARGVDVVVAISLEGDNVGVSVESW